MNAITHRIGGNSSYDGDMDLIETFVKCYEEPENVNIQTFVFEYYVDKLIHYWDEYGKFMDEPYEKILKEINFRNGEGYKIGYGEEYDRQHDREYYTWRNIFLERKDKRKQLYGMNTVEKKIRREINNFDSEEEALDYYFPLDANYRTDFEIAKKMKAPKEKLIQYSMSGHGMIKKLVDEYEKNTTKFISLLQEAEDNFDHTLKFDNLSILNIFVFIGEHNCLLKEDLTYYGFFRSLKKQNIIQDNNIFVVANDTGYFSINTWLYSYFNRIHLLGISIKGAKFDNRIECSLDMMGHDLFHMRIYTEKYNETEILEKIWIDILNNFGFSTLEKELNILVLWIYIHEMAKFEYGFLDEPLNRVLTNYLFQLINTNVISEYSEEFGRFQDIYDEEDIKDAILYINPCLDFSISLLAEGKSSSPESYFERLNKYLVNVMKNLRSHLNWGQKISNESYIFVDLGKKMAMKVEYGFGSSFIDITEKVLTQFRNGNEIYIPNSDMKRSEYFGDPIFGQMKKIRVTKDDHVVYYDDNEAILINLDESFKYKLSPKLQLSQIHSELFVTSGNMTDEYPEQLMAMMFVKPNDIVLELGANIGRNTLVISKILNDSSNLLTVETDPKSAAILEKNRIDNDLNFKIENSAISKTRIVQCGWDCFKTSDDSLRLTDNFFDVKTITFTDLMQKYNMKFTVLVCDCEGALHGILMEEPNFLDGIETIIVENDYKNVGMKNEVCEIYKKLGYKCVYRKALLHKLDFYEVWRKDYFFSWDE